MRPQGQRLWRQTRARYHNPIAEHLNHNLAACILVIAMRDCIHQRLSERLRGVLVETDSLQTNDSDGMPCVAIDKRYHAVYCDGNGTAHVLLVRGVTIGQCAPVSVAEEATLREDGRGVLPEKNDAGRGPEVLP